MLLNAQPLLTRRNFIELSTNCCTKMAKCLPYLQSTQRMISQISLLTTSVRKCLTSKILSQKEKMWICYQILTLHPLYLCLVFTAWLRWRYTSCSPMKHCSLDPIPTRQLEDMKTAKVAVPTKLVNLSLSSGTVPLQMKEAVVQRYLRSQP
jgi:hypothetical protein